MKISAAMNYRNRYLFGRIIDDVNAKRKRCEGNQPLKDEYPETLKVSSQAVAAIRRMRESANATPRLVGPLCPP